MLTKELMLQMLDGIQSSAPRTYARLVATLDGQQVTVEADGERFRLTFARTGHLLRDVASPTGIHVRLTRRTLIDLVQGELTLLDALASDALFVAASVSEVVAWQDALVLICHGAARSPRAIAVFDKYQRDQQKQTTREWRP